MTTNPNAANDVMRSNDALNSSHLERRTTSSTLSSSNKRFSFASSENGESSTAASKRNSLLTPPLDDAFDGKNDRSDVVQLSKDGRGSHRSHRSKNSGGFLLSNSTFEPPATAEHIPHSPSHRDIKGKAVLRTPEKKHTKKRSGVGLGIARSPLAANVATAETNDAGGDATLDQDREAGDASGAKPTAIGLDVDSAQIVNLALNLSESRWNAARRNISSPLPPTPGLSGLGEGFTGGSLRLHLQQQRRVSRNVSPKPDRGSRAMTASPRVASGQRISSPLQSAFESRPDGPYQYHFSASTLARAEKAKNVIELMAQYRRLLQYVPPLKPQSLERSSTAGSAIPDSPLAASRTVSTTSTRQLGREYNPIQYIRNRRLRARERRGIDGEAQGFGDVDKVSSWIDLVSEEASFEESKAADCLSLPAFSQAAEAAASPYNSHNSPHTTLGKSQATAIKIKRPRYDWITNPADMIADVFWLEQDDNKKSIEDRFGRLIFPQSTELKRPMSHRSEEPESQKPLELGNKRAETKSPDLRIDTRMPQFRSVRSDSEKYSDRARQKLREATHIHHGHHGSVREHGHLRLGSHSRSYSDSSDDGVVRHPHHRRSGTADSHDRGRDILEKQMMEMLAKESRENEQSVPQDIGGKGVFGSIEAQEPVAKESSKSQNNLSGHSRSGSIANKESHSRRGSSRNGSSGRASLEVPSFNPRGSLDGLDSTAPNSPQTKANIATSFVPSIALDLSTPIRGRPSSPTRNPLLRVKSKINQLQEHSRDRSRSRANETETPILLTPSKEATPGSPETLEKRRRSISPAKKVLSRKADESPKDVRKAGSIRRGKSSEESSGIRGLFKGSRYTVARVSDFIWKKEPSAVGISSGCSTDDSDIEDLRVVAEKKSSRTSSTVMKLEDNDDASLWEEKPSYLGDMPVFASPFERRGRPTRTENDEIPSSSLTQRQQAREERRKTSRARLLEPPPRIDVQSASPTSSPDSQPADRSRRGSSISDLDSHRASFSNGVKSADARLNAILRISGHRGDIYPVTGLSSLEASHDHRPSMDGKRQWSISDRDVSAHRSPMTKQEIARVRALLLSSGIKAKEISRRAAEIKDLQDAGDKTYRDIAPLAQQKVVLVPKSQEHILAARILADDIQLSSRMWQASADFFTGVTIQDFLDRIEALQDRLVDHLTPMARKAADEADEVSKDLMTSQTLKVKRTMDKMDKMMRARRRRLRWLRRGGWVLVEWALVGVMWFVWFLVVFVRVVMGIGNGVVGVVRWLLFR